MSPHLSTLDVLYLHNCLGELLLHTYFDLGNSNSPFTLKQIEVKAGNSPIENLANIPLSISLESTDKIANGFCKNTSAVILKIGSMTVRSQFEHNGVLRSDVRPFPVLFDPTSDLPFAKEHKFSMEAGRAPHLDQVHIDLSLRSVKADFALQHQAENIFQFITPIETVAAMAQLAQALIYEIDGLNRSETNTLWMRNLVYESIGHTKQNEKISAHAWIDSDKSIQKAGQHWRTYRVLGRLGSSRGICLITHQIP